MYLRKRLVNPLEFYLEKIDFAESFTGDRSKTIWTDLKNWGLLDYIPIHLKDMSILPHILSSNSLPI
jgi:hypothetical protein